MVARDDTLHLWTQVAKDVAILEERLSGLDRLVEARFVAVSATGEAQADKVVLALAAADKAVLKAEAATSERFAAVNEFRQTLSDQAGSFINRDQFEALRETLAALAARLDRIEGRSTGISAGWGYLLGAVGLAATIISVLIATR